MTYRQDPPFSIHMEAVEGCNLRCSFCGIRGIREKGTREDASGPYFYMDLGLVERISRQVQILRWAPRWEFAMHGEPTMHPELPALIEIIRSYHPTASIMVTTNGVPMHEERADWHRGGVGEACRRLLMAGVNTVLVDDYKPHKVSAALREYGGRLNVLEYPANKDANPHARHSGHRVVIVQDILEATSGNHATLNNHCGAAAPPSDVMRDRVCTIPFRELSIRWNGELALCCNDWRGQYRVGSAEDLEAAWHGERFHAARALLYHEGRADITPCSGCDYRGRREGLLPDKQGKKTMPEPTAADRAVVRAAASEGTMVPVVLRKWESPSARIDQADLRPVASALLPSHESRIPLHESLTGDPVALGRSGGHQAP